MRMTRRPSQVVAGLAAVCLLAASCSDPEGNATPTTEPAPTAPSQPSASPPPGPTPWPKPTRPEATEREDIEGAKVAAQYFLELHPYAFATGDLTEWHALSHPECDFCAGSASHVADLFGSDGYAIGGEYQIDDVEASEPTDGQDYYLVTVRGVEEPSTEYSSDGLVTAQFEGGPFEYFIALSFEGNQWVVRGVNWEE